MFGDPVTNPMGWEVKKLDELVDVKPQNGLYKPLSEYTNDGSGIPILRIDAFYSGRITGIDSLKRLMCTPKEITTYSLRETDIVINRVNSMEYLGKCAYITGLSEDTVFESNMMRFNVGTNANALFIVEQLCSRFVYNQILQHAKKAVNQASINQSDVQDLNLLIPPLPLQNKFADFVQATDKSKFDWNNLFLTCGHCNNIKGKRYDDILDPTKCDPEEHIALSIEITDNLIDQVQVESLKEDSSTLRLLNY